MKLESVRFATVAEVVEAHDAAILTSGGALGIPRPESLEGAVMAVQATYGGAPLLATLADIAAGYIFYICRSHAFLDGNKRTALATALTFLAINNYPLTLFDLRQWPDIVVAVAEGRVSREELAELFAAQMGEWGELT